MLQHQQIRAPIAVVLGAIAGALCRFYLSRWLTLWLGNNFALGTFWVNLSGCLLMGFVTTTAINRSVHPVFMLLTATGFLGAYTTFSSYVLEVFNFFDNQEFIKGIAYWFGSSLLGVISICAGMFLAHQLYPAPDLDHK